MNFGEALATCFYKKFFIIRGRARRSEFWFFFLFNFLVCLVLLGVAFSTLISSLMDDQSNFSSSVGTFSILGIYLLAILIPNITVSVRRLHDLNKSGFWYLIVFLLGLIPFIGWIFSIVMLIYFAFPGTQGKNRFDDPKNAKFSFSNSIKLFTEDCRNMFSKSDDTSQPTDTVPSENNLEKLEKLHALKGKGVITEEEFQIQKNNILGKDDSQKLLKKD